ncbi:MAG: hypothetical protein [Grapevine-associated levi-like virus 10]|uniref:Coat protein n=1 Tax=Grapevine-associated levi-like virus 10 TaxID=2814355 RepID=A0A8F5MJI4_9VIRU|nr:MAG: hypothetical protein [Grapevine-associated levi-like virus 10]
MPQLNPLVLKDGAATPANHTFQPRDITGGVAALVESTGVPIGDRRITLALNRTTAGRLKASVKVAIPIVQDQVLNGVSRPAIVRTAYADVVFSFDGTSSTDERKDLMAFVSNMFKSDQAMMAGFVVDLQGVY